MSVSSDRTRGKHSGMTLIEMVLFIVVIGIAGAVLLTAISSPLTGAGTQTQAVTAAQVAQARMELIVGQKRREGFPGTDPCQDAPDLAACELPDGWAQPEAELEEWAEANDPDLENYAVWAVTAINPEGGTHTIRTLVTRLGN